MVLRTWAAAKPAIAAALGTQVWSGKDLPGDESRILPVPQLEHQQLPEPERVVALAGAGARRRAAARTAARSSRAAAPARRQHCRRTARAGRRGTRRRAGRRSPACGRSRISRGSSAAATSLSMCLRRPFLIFSDAGSVTAKSTTSLSSSGTRDSIECAMLMRSTLVRQSSGR